MVVVNLEPEYGYVALAAASTVFLNMWHMLKIGGLRKQLNIQYPIMFSDKHEIFNCYQRAHQNLLEQVPYFLSCLCISGLRHPKLAAGFGGVWIVARIIYALGYYTGNPKKRVPGFLLSMFGAQLPLTVLSISFGAGLLGWW